MAALMCASPIIVINMNEKVQAAENSVIKTVMHNALAYDKDGNSTGHKYYVYGSVHVDPKPVTINGDQYYKVTDKDEYIKVTNIDGVKRKITHNTYIYRTSTGRTSYNGRWKLYKGETITTYGGSYKFKNGKHYFRVGGPRKQYVKSYNLGPIISSNIPASGENTNNSTSITTQKNADETTVTVDDTKTPIITFDQSGNVVRVKDANDGEKFVVDRKETGARADKVANFIGQFGGAQAIYRIKGTDNWIYSMGVKVSKDIPAHYYDNEKFSLVRFQNAADLYNENGVSLNAKMKKNSITWKVDKLVYIWVPSENKAEEFYHLSPFIIGYEISYIQYASHEIAASTNIYDKGAYVKASDVSFEDKSVKLSPSNTPEQAKATYEANSKKAIIK